MTGRSGTVSGRLPSRAPQPSTAGSNSSLQGVQGAQSVSTPMPGAIAAAGRSASMSQAVGSSKTGPSAALGGKKIVDSKSSSSVSSPLNNNLPSQAGGSSSLSKVPIVVDTKGSSSTVPPCSHTQMHPNPKSSHHINNTSQDSSLSTKAFDEAGPAPIIAKQDKGTGDAATIGFESRDKLSPLSAPDKLRGYKAKVLCKYQRRNEDELDLTVGDEITLLLTPEGGWWLGTLPGRSSAGWFPANYVDAPNADGDTTLQNTAAHPSTGSTQSNVLPSEAILKTSATSSSSVTTSGLTATAADILLTDTPHVSSLHIALQAATSSTPQLAQARTESFSAFSGQKRAGPTPSLGNAAPSSASVKEQLLSSAPTSKSSGAVGAISTPSSAPKPFPRSSAVTAAGSPITPNVVSREGSTGRTPTFTGMMKIKRSGTK